MIITYLNNVEFSIVTLHIQAVVTRTGANTFFGKAAGMIAGVQSSGHLQKVYNLIFYNLQLQTTRKNLQVLLSITIVLLILSVVLCVIIFAILMTTDTGDYPQTDATGSSKFVNALSVVR